MQADAKHQQHHADFGQLTCQSNIRNESRRGRSNHDAGGKVADQRRQFQAHSNKSEHQRESQRGGNCRNQRNVMRHDASPHFSYAAVEAEGVVDFGLHACMKRSGKTCVSVSRN